jgi:hypothetical protein
MNEETAKEYFGRLGMKPAVNAFGQKTFVPKDAKLIGESAAEKLPASAYGPPPSEQPGEAIPFPKQEEWARAMAEAIESLNDAFFEFDSLGDKLEKELLNESHEAEIAKIKTLLAKANERMDRAEKIVPPSITSAQILASIKVWSMQSDNNVNTANLAIFNLVNSGKWTSAVPYEFKRAYVELIEAVSRLYNRLIEIDENYCELIRKTKSIIGKQINDMAKLPSATDNGSFKWLTQTQFSHGMKPEELSG